MIQASIVTLLAGHVICHTQAIKRGQNQNKLKHTQIFKCAGYYPVDLADVFLLKKLYHFCDLHISEQEEFSAPKKNWLSSYLKMLEK